PVDFDTCPDHAVIRGIDGQRSYPRDAHIGAFFGDVGRQLVPVPPAVARPEQRRRAGAGEDDVRVRWIESHLPDVEGVHRRFETLEVLAAIFAAVDAIIRAGQNGARLSRVNRKSEHPAFGPKPGPDLPPAFSVVGTDPGAGSDSADADRVVIGHWQFP